MVSGSSDSNINLWDVEGTRPANSYSDHSNEVLGLDVFEMDGNIFASGSSDLSFNIWDVRTKKACIRSYQKNKCGITRVKFMPENVNTLAVGNEDETKKLWDLRALGKVAKLTEPKCFEAV